MPIPWSRRDRQVTLHAFVVGEQRCDLDSIVFRIIASAGFRTGLTPADPQLREAATFGTDPGTKPAVYVASEHSRPAEWIRFDDAVAVLATDGSPVLRFRAMGRGVLPTPFRHAAERTRRVAVVDVDADSGENRRIFILFVTPQVSYA